MFSKQALRRLILPLIIEQFLAVMVGMADIMMVSSAGEAAVSSVALVDLINVLIINIFAALATGGAVVCAQSIGAQNLERANRAANQLLYIVTAAALGIMVLVLFCKAGLLGLLFGQVEPEVMEGAVTYFVISALSYPFIAVYNGCAALLRAIGLHTIYVLISVVIGFAAGLVFGILLSRIPRWLSGIIIPILSIFQTIPGLVFIGVLFIWWGNIYPTVIVALSVYAMFPVLKNTYTGILEVEPKYIEAAKGCGMSSFQTLVRVELPLAMPVIISGLRMAAIYTVSWAVLASMIGLGGLGDFVYRGTSSNNNTLILLGAIPAAILAVLFGLVIDLLQKRVTPRGLRKEAGK